MEAREDDLHAAHRGRRRPLGGLREAQAQQVPAEGCRRLIGGIVISPLPSTVNCINHGEDVDLSGGRGAVAAALKSGQLGVELSGTDTLQIPRKIDYLGYMYVSENTPDEDGAVTIGNKREYEIPMERVPPAKVCSYFAPSPIKLASRESIDLIGMSAAAGGHQCSHFVDDPKLGDGFDLGSPEGADICIAVAQPTGTLVAETISGLTDICGRTVAYVLGQNKIPNNSDIDLVLYGITPLLSAGYTAIAIRHQDGNRQLILPARDFGTGPELTQRYDLAKMFGGNGLKCNAENPLEIGAMGVGTTAQGALLEIAMFGVGQDG